MPPPVAEYNNFHMNTEVYARVFGSNAATVIADVSFELVQLENVLSCYLPESEISRINQNAGIAQVPVSSGTFEMLSFAVQLSRISGGLFDITVKPLIDLWTFKKAVSVPDAQKIRQILELVNYRDIQLNPVEKTVGIRRVGQSIDAGGIAKGYASDRVIKKLQQQGISSAFINIGGNVSTLGNKPDGSTWRVGIRHPRRDVNLLGAVDVSNLAEFPGTEAVFADDDCHIFITRGLKDCFRSADGIAYSIL